MKAPVGHTCPDIDKAIKIIQSAQKLFNQLDKQGIDDCYYESSCLDDAIDLLEDLRKSNDALRSWGYGLDEELDKAWDRISELEYGKVD